jgi:hypothetical protein
LAASFILGRSAEYHQATRSHVRFSNRPFEVKHFQAIHHCSVDVAHGLALLLLMLEAANADLVSPSA